MKVLLVDPDLKRAPALKNTLSAGGAEVTVASSGSFALTMLEWNRHDVVVSRARIGDMEGHELCAILKADPGTREVRFVLVAGADDVAASDTASAGVDLVLPPAMMGGAILPLLVRLIQANRTVIPELAPPSATPPPLATPPGGVPVVAPPRVTPPSVTPATPGPPAAHEGVPDIPRIRPEAPPPPTAEPPKRYATMVTAGPEGEWANGAPSTAPAAPNGSQAPVPPARPSKTPTTSRSTGTTPPRTVPSVAPSRTSGFKPAAPGSKPAAPAAPTPPSRPAATPSIPDLSSMPSGTFQGSLEVLELADLTQAIGGGGKSGRLILALPQGGGLILFDKGRVVHAEYRNAVGEEAFGALLAACHADGAGRFCFLPSPAGEAAGPRTIDKGVDQLLLSSATAIDEKA
jgi:CheY-like chemotaxis protein